MGRSSDAKVAQRINGALLLLKKLSTRAEAAVALAKRHGISRRQAHRYVVEAAKRKVVLPIPERKIVFTVKLPRSLAQRLRGLARSTGESLSGMVTRALEVFLKRGRHG